MAVLFTDREMQRAWQSNLKASIQDTRSNSHRLLLFYAVECGLKAVLMKRGSVTCTRYCKEINKCQHDINKLLDALGAGQKLKLPSRFNMNSINERGSKQERKLDPGKINQMWRYGGKVIDAIDESGNSVSLTDEHLEERLTEISRWIQRELER
jgi:hypothetical protein